MEKVTLCIILIHFMTFLTTRARAKALSELDESKCTPYNLSRIAFNIFSADKVEG